MREDLVIKVPGKLMVAGEFAVLEPEQKMLVTAVNRFVYAAISEAPQNKVSLPDFNLHELSWEWEQEHIQFASSDVRLDFIANAMEVVFNYLQEQQIPVRPVHLKVTSELADDSGIKYGLGSSAAVVTAVTEAILVRFMGQDVQRELIFKLAAVSHVKTQGSGSGADIAASSFGGLIQYASFQSDWLLDAIKQTSSITEILEKEWKYLSIKPIPVPDFIQFLTAWTGSAASTKDLVARMRVMKHSKPEPYQKFLEDSRQAVDKITDGLEKQEQARLFEGIVKNREALRMLGEMADVPIETPALADLSICAGHVKGAGKLSGAGGGDCGIAFIPLEEEASALQQCWKNKGIKPLSLKMYERTEK